MDGADRLIEKAAYSIAMDGRQKFLESIAVGGEQIIPDGRISLLIDDLKRPVRVGARRAVYADSDHDVVVDKFAGELGKLVLLFVFGHRSLIACGRAEGQPS